VPTGRDVLGHGNIRESGLGTEKRGKYAGGEYVLRGYYSDTPRQDARDYVKYLCDEEGFISLVDADFDVLGHAELGRNSVYPGYKIIVLVDYDADGYTTKVIHLEGKITP